MLRCSACGAENRVGARFCDTCAEPLAKAPARELRRTVTVVFADITGSTELGERLDAESLRRVLARYFEESRGAIERHGGTVEKFIGDAVMAVFGVPALHEDDALRAVRASAELRAGLTRVNLEVEREYGTKLQVRIGVNTGEVVTGTEERLVTGDAVNLAARLQQAAAPDEILLGSETLALVRDDVTVEGLEPLHVKGKAAAVDAYRLIAIGSAAPRPAGAMVGRRQELALLADAFAGAVAERRCVLVTLVGAAGAGKSRLTREFLDGLDARMATGRCLSYGEGITYWPVVEVVKQLDDVATRVTAGSRAAAAALDALYGGGSAATPGEIAWLVRSLLQEAAAKGPLVVVFDDIHWGAPTFVDLVDNLAASIRRAPVLILCLARPELLDDRPDWPAVTLQLLDEGETDELIDQLLGPGGLEPALAADIRAAAGGNPLFVEEMLAMLRESGGREVVVPPTIKALLAARLDRLALGERTVLEHGSVEGQLFHRGALEALAASAAPVEPELAELVRKELVRPDRAQVPADAAYRFRHLLIRDAAYDALSKNARADLHERFAAWIEERGTDLVERDEIVGFHLEQAYRYQAELGVVDDAGRALAARGAQSLVRSARRARFRGDPPAAASLLGRAADLDPAGRLDILPHLAEVLFALGDLAGAIEVLDEALASAREIGDERIEAIAKVLRAVTASQMGDLSIGVNTVVELAAASGTLMERLGDQEWLATVLEIEARYRLYLGRAKEAETIFARALTLAARTGDLVRAQECAIWCCAAMVYGSTPITAAAAYPELVPSALRETLFGRVMGLVHQAYCAAHSGLFDRAREQLAEAILLADDLGVGLERLTMPVHAGSIELLAGEDAAAAQALREGFDRLTELKMSGYASSVACLLAQALLNLGRDAEAEEVVDRAFELAPADDFDPQIKARYLRAQILARRGESLEGERLAREAIELVAVTDYLSLHGEALLGLAVVLEAGGRRDEAAAWRREALELFERKEDVARADRTRRLLGAEPRHPLSRKPGGTGFFRR